MKESSRPVGSEKCHLLLSHVASQHTLSFLVHEIKSNLSFMILQSWRENCKEGWILIDRSLISKPGELYVKSMLEAHERHGRLQIDDPASG